MILPLKAAATYTRTKTVNPKDVAIDSTRELSRRQSVGVAAEQSKYSLSENQGRRLAECAAAAKKLGEHEENMRQLQEACRVKTQKDVCLPVIPPDEPVSPVVPPEVSVVEQPNTMDPVARYKKNRVHRYSVQIACRP